MKVLDLFSGIGGLSLGLERAGMTTTGFCEIDPFCRKVLAKHWPGVPCHDDINTLDGRQWAGVGLICGGFPCQDISVAGRGEGLAGERSGLFFELARVVSEATPRWVLLENVSVLRARGLDVVLRTLAALGYDAQWHCVPASAVGAPHRRDRIWIVAHTHGSRLAFWEGLRSHLQQELTSTQRSGGAGGWWSAEPAVGRVAHGLSGRVDELRSLGNAVVPQVVEIFGRAIMQMED